MRFRKRPCEIEAIQWTGFNTTEVSRWMDLKLTEKYNPIESGYLISFTHPINISIRTLEGDMKAIPGDWIIRGVRGELYPCKPDIFVETYEEVLEPSHYDEAAYDPE